MTTAHILYVGGMRYIVWSSTNDDSHRRPLYGDARTDTVDAMPGRRSVLLLQQVERVLLATLGLTVCGASPDSQPVRRVPRSTPRATQSSSPARSELATPPAPPPPVYKTVTEKQCTQVPKKKKVHVPKGGSAGVAPASGGSAGTQASMGDVGGASPDAFTQECDQKTADEEKKICEDPGTDIVEIKESPCAMSRCHYGDTRVKGASDRSLDKSFPMVTGMQGMLQSISPTFDKMISDMEEYLTGANAQTEPQSKDKNTDARQGATTKERCKNMYLQNKVDIWGGTGMRTLMPVDKTLYNVQDGSQGKKICASRKEILDALNKGNKLSGGYNEKCLRMPACAQNGITYLPTAMTTGAGVGGLRCVELMVHTQLRVERMLRMVKRETRHLHQESRSMKRKK